MPDTYASGRWQVVPGREDEFIVRWKEFLEWTRLHHPAMIDASLLQEVTTQSDFISFSEWKNADARDHWKHDPGFAVKMSACQALCQRMVGKDYERVVHVP
ncbi:antibiotic biosynthesis monooxygenase [Arthrobacter sp. ISL-30]|uniref:antibiotic biosynthesis monooxygenase n=1 Tax=Arthrobacter sp. ISL-30 TaxID=2819109 RepID=UPI001BE8807B|nr:antibiotic biosynthesis monooxygenase [Arthrobacter sp. ISL-30]MBT2515776.1 antibiotic biosynthesis monooxygenase [Arthrobacter sp. ISL-30]